MMDGIDKITSRISADTDREVAEIQAQAAAEAAELTAQYSQRAKQESEDILARGRTAAAEREERLASVAQLEARKLILAAKQEVLEETFRQALEDLLHLPEQEYVELLAKLIVQASQSGTEEVIFSQKDRPRYGKAAVTRANELLGGKGRLTLAVETRPIGGGFILSDGAVEVNGTFETLVRLQRRELDAAVAKVLFDDGV